MWNPGFGWEGALVAFLTFNAVKGVDMMMQAYLSIFEGRTPTPGEDAQAVGKGYIVNYFVQLLATIGAGGYVCRKRTKSKIGKLKLYKSPAWTSRLTSGRLHDSRSHTHTHRCNDLAVGQSLSG